MSSVRIAVDAMGGDRGSEVVVQAAIDCLSRFKDLSLILVGDKALLEQQMAAVGSAPSDRLTLQHASTVVAMDEPPAQALRNKKDSSMRVALDLVHSKQADACVSAGNTGALMATARFVLKTLPGIDRPAIVAKMPTAYGHTCMLDLGANVDCSAEQLYQFAIMGSILMSATTSRPEPSVALLNIGIEDTKGNDCVKEAARQLAQSQTVNYIGYIEGDAVFHRPVDVIVCDGFVGNIALKTSEGVAKMMEQFMLRGFRRNVITRLIGLFAWPVLKSVRKQMDPRHYNGASLLGLRGIVIKSHGGADCIAFTHAIIEAMVEAKSGVVQRISERVAVATGSVENS